MDRVLDAGWMGLSVTARTRYNNVSITCRDYADAYYQDFFYYTREKRGDGRITARPVDSQVDSKSAVSPLLVVGDGCANFGGDVGLAATETWTRDRERREHRGCGG